MAVLRDRFRAWTLRNRTAATYERYRYRLRRFVETYPALNTDELRPRHAEQWAGGLSTCQTSHRNDCRSIKRCMKWATRQGFVDKNRIEPLEVPSGEAKGIYVPPDEFAQLRSKRPNRNPALRSSSRISLREWPRTPKFFADFAT